MRKNIFIIVLFAARMTNHVVAQTNAEIMLPTLLESIEIGLKNNYDIKNNQLQVEKSKGDKQSAKGVFDPSLNVNVSTMSGILLPDKDRNPSSLNLSLTVPTKLGINASTGFVSSQTKDPTNNDATQLVNGTWLQLDMPLLKGIGKSNMNLLNQNIAALNLASTQVSFDYEVTRFIKNVTLAYLKIVYKDRANKDHEVIIHDLEAYKDTLQQKINNNTVGSVEILNVKAELAQLKSDLNSAYNEIKNDYLDYRKLLGLETASLTTQNFAAPEAPPAMEGAEIKRYVSDVLIRKSDIARQSLAFKKQKLKEESLSKEVKIANYAKRNDLSLQLRYNYYSEVDGGRWNSFWIYPQTSSYPPGSSYLLTLTYKLPFGNNAAKGAYMAKKSDYEFQKTSNEQLLFEMETNVETLSNDLLNSVEALETQKEIAKLREQIYLNEVSKYHEHTTQMNVLNAHQGYMESLLTIQLKEYAVYSNWLNLKFLCNDIPQNFEQLSALLK